MSDTLRRTEPGCLLLCAQNDLEGIVGKWKISH
jgi:hypothetical protein